MQRKGATQPVICGIVNASRLRPTCLFVHQAVGKKRNLAQHTHGCVCVWERANATNTHMHIHSYLTSSAHHNTHHLWYAFRVTKYCTLPFNFSSYIKQESTVHWLYFFKNIASFSHRLHSIGLFVVIGCTSTFSLVSFSGSPTAMMLFLRSSAGIFYVNAYSQAPPRLYGGESHPHNKRTPHGKTSWWC